MGSILITQRCDHHSDESVINLSESCVDKLLRPPEERENVVCKPTDARINDDKWMKKLRCKDELHSKEYGITLAAMEDLLKSVECKIGEIKRTECPTEDLIACLKENCNCISKCEKYMNEFIDCTDTARLEAIKKSYMVRKQEEQEEASCELNSEQTCPPEDSND